jgi:hypothetical protein
MLSVGDSDALKLVIGVTVVMKQKDPPRPSELLQTLRDRDRSLRQEIEDSEERLQVRVAAINRDRAKLKDPPVESAATQRQRRGGDCLYDETNAWFKNGRIKCIGEHLDELQDWDLLFYLDRATKRYRDAGGETWDSLRYQALQLRMIRVAHEELQERIRRMQA